MLPAAEDTTTLPRSDAPIPPRLLRHPVHLLSLGFGSGLAPVAPGTWGTLMAMPLYWMAHSLPSSLYLMLVLGMVVLGVLLCGYTSRALGVHDHGGIVWDEMTGYFVTMIAAPPGWGWMVAGFLLFRLFDIWKPWPIGWLDRRLTGGLGIMMDDLLAGLYALLVIQLAALFFSGG